ncbi:cytochrome P450 [Zhongshania sp. BJYM1]|uniref:cytochrome P450 n=1 Tax=Zhongshania aquatica TaxID=2965069 RepID=UPI0022B4D724|nr:cytochrome P450 [Marortus sp. BJYM1]
MPNILYHSRRLLLSYLIEALLRHMHWRKKRSQADVKSAVIPLSDAQIPEHPKTPEDFRPLENACFQNPYRFYKMLREEYPVYRLQNGIYCLSRYDDIAAVCRDTEVFSSTHQGAIVGLKPHQTILEEGRKQDRLAALGLTPCDVLAVADQPQHSNDRKVGHKGLNSRFVKSLEGEIESACSELIDKFIDSGEVEFMQQVAWQLPMQIIIKLLGFPVADYQKIKYWCMHTISTQSGVSSSLEIAKSRAEILVFVRYCWRQLAIAKRHPRNDLCGVFVSAVLDPENPMTDQQAVSSIFQLLVAGSDSSATSMGNAIKLLIENPEIQAEVRADMTKLDSFIEEVFRLEAAFQGHFRWTKIDTELHDVVLPAGSRVFLMWAAANRDETVFENPDSVDLNRPNGKKHLTFGHGIHACIGRELARSEIRIVLRAFLLRTKNIRMSGDAPFVASMFAHTLQRLPLRFEVIEDSISEHAA